MLYLIVTILTATAILLVFKIAGKYNANNLHIITINYFVAACLGMVISVVNGADILYTNYNWFNWSIGYGIFFILGFLLFGYSTQKSGLTATAISSRVSVIIPVILGFIFFEEIITNTIICGILAAIIALVLINLPSKSKSLSTQNQKNTKTVLVMLLPIFLFFGIGANDSMIKAAQYFLIKNNDYSEFISSCFIFSTLGGLAIMLFSKKLKISLPSIIIGSILGIINYVNFSFLLIGLSKMNVSVFMPIYNIGVVVLSSLIGVIIYREKLSKINIIGIFISVLAIILLMI